MKKIATLNVLFLVFLFMSTFSYALSNVYDDFNGGSVNTELWFGYTGSILSQSDGKLQIDGPPNSIYENLTSTSAFVGDFTFDLDFQNFSTSNVTDFSGPMPSISLQVTKLTDSENNFVYIVRAVGQFVGDHFGSNGKLGGVWGSATDNSTSAASGTLRITRTGATISTYYNTGADWILLQSFENAFTGAVTVQVGGSTSNNGTFHAESDGITYDGRLAGGNPLPGVFQLLLFN